jgi:hypothetical protein
MVLRAKSERWSLANEDCPNLIRVGAFGGQGIVDVALGILQNPAELKRRSRRHFPFGSGRAAPKIAHEILLFLGVRQRMEAAHA